MLSQQFIKATGSFATYEKTVPAPYLRRTFQLEHLPDRATLTLTCTGFYRLWVNGCEITDGRLAPGISNPDEMLFYDTYEIGDRLTVGRNCIALLLGNGFSNSVGGFIWDFDKAAFRSAPMLALALETVQDDKASVLLEADEDFRCAPSPIRFDDLRSGEHYDATCEISGWNLPDFDDAAWTAAIPVQPARGEKRLNQADRVRVTRELSATRMMPGRIAQDVHPEQIRPASRQLSECTFYHPAAQERGMIYEFPENTAFVPRLRIRGKKGQQIVLQTAEYCSADAELSFENIAMYYPRGFSQRDIYVCRGEGEEEYIPSFTYHGGRYVMVIGAEDGQLTPDSVTMLVQNSDLPERGDFSCSDPLVNRLQRNARISDLSNFVWFPTDCPHREKNGWTGDAAMSCEHMLQTLGAEKSLCQWLRMICAAQNADGALPGIVPTSGWGFAWGNGPVWDQVLVEIPYRIYLYRGDSQPFAECAGSVLRYLHHLSVRRDARGLLCIGLGDWCHAMRQGSSNHLCPNEVTDTFTAYSICRRAEFLYRVIGQTAEAAYAGTLGDEFLAAARKYLVNFDTMTVAGNCQCAQAIGLYDGIFEGAERPAAYRRLVEMIHAAGDRIDFGMLGTRTVFRVLGDFGDFGLAMRMITRTDAPSYGIMVEKFGMVSLPETFEKDINGYATSLNHHFLADFSGCFIRYLAGLEINPYRDNAAYVRVAPTFVPSLDRAQAYYDTVCGRIGVSWTRTQEKIELRVDAAEGITGEIVLPDGYVFSEADGLRQERITGRMQLHLQSGRFVLGPRH